MMSVSSLNTKIKSLLEATFMHTLVEGEVASVTYHTSGHLYFSIKDDKSAIKCVMWRSSVSRMKFRIEKGMHIVVEGSVSVYTPRGEYQFQTVRIEPYGQGALALAYEQLKEKLKQKGYFDASRKKAIPKHLEKIVLVTAKESAALHDMLKIIEKRWALLDVIIVDTLVQGEDASTQIARSLRYADTLDADVVVVGRGGGSAEDLWSFNEERVADAIFHMHTPVVSAVGHEVDVMISDFVADLRAPTPSAAMEMILPDSREILYTLNELNERYSYSLREILQRKTREVNHVEELVLSTSPLRKLMEIVEKFNIQKQEFKRILTYKIESFSSQLPEIHARYKEQISLQIQRKEQYLSVITQKFKMHNPTLQCHDGWAQISYMGKKVPLKRVEIDKKFILDDGQIRVEALCLSKNKS
ncbi:MAG TPA: exodeoxyribonuclease VII large subunit [Epsilonproteobacteria bacterium]|nr:exodeoxyribonuclease VII large subunit [Campylobacterota bacterium]HHE06044.1 exodeoxyribonuclease VII large subunit [Campylobacterota bacterium]